MLREHKIHTGTASILCAYIHIMIFNIRVYKLMMMFNLA